MHSHHMVDHAIHVPTDNTSQDAFDSFNQCGYQVSTFFLSGREPSVALVVWDGTLGPSTQLGLLAAGWRGDGDLPLSKV